ncbi:hypothetical protein [Geminocystis herdmanii]|uniref:hypothetical protein n=1 Tax=Geminocystis herdmanii TaxID=669359 RepID=UPI0003461567|nr:hypothetical protein [Geminocystis herdmanii]
MTQIISPIYETDSYISNSILCDINKKENQKSIIYTEKIIAKKNQINKNYYPVKYVQEKSSISATNLKRSIPSVEYVKYSPAVIPQKTSIFNLENIENNLDFQMTVKSLLDLQEINPDLEEEDEDEIYYPSDYAFSGCIELLIKLYHILGDTFPYGFASVESRGGVDLIWKNKVLDKQVWFEFPVDDSFQSSVYYRQGDTSHLIQQPEIKLIAKLLQWLFSEDSFYIL